MPRQQASASSPLDGRRRSSLLPFVIVGVALLARLVLCAQLGNHLVLKPNPAGTDDTAVYTHFADRVAAGDLALGPDPYYVSPFYAYFLGLLLALGGHSLAVARTVQAVLGAATVALVMATSSAWFGRRAGLIAGALAALTGLFAFNEILILQSAVDPFLTSLALFAFSRAIQSAVLADWALSGAVFAALALNRPNVLPFIGVAALAWVALQRSRKAVYAAAALILGAALLLAPVVVRNRLVGGEWVLISSHGGLNFYIGNGEGADGTWRAVPGITASMEGQARDTRTVASAALHHPVSFGEASDYYYVLAWSWIRSHPFDWIKLLSYKLALAFNARDDAVQYSYAYFVYDEPTILRLLVVGPFLIVPLGLFGLWVGRPAHTSRLRHGYLLWVSFAAVYAATLVAFFVTSRFRLTLLVPLLVGAGGGGAWLLGAAWRPAPWRTLPILLLLFGIVALPLHVNDGRMNEREEYAVALIREARFDEADRIVNDTMRIDPQRGVFLLRAASACRDKGDNQRALAYLELAHDAEPRNGAVELALGEALLQAGRPADAIAHLEAARSAGRATVTTTYEIASSLASLGHREEALAQIRQVDPSSIVADGLMPFGDLAMRLEEPGTAEPFFAEAVRREPADWKSHDALGVAYAAAQKIGLALAEFDAARRIAPEEATVRFHLGLALAEAGRVSEARGELAEALHLRPDYQDAMDLLARLPARR